jgi:hypothetical protein
LFGVVDFHKSCIESQGKILDLSGRPIYYRRCSGCGFVFTDEFDDWSTEAFLAHIYNDEYILVDPDYVIARPTNNAKIIAEAFHASRNFLSILDFGGGNGLMASTLVKTGFNATTYDPLSAFTQQFDCMDSLSGDGQCDALNALSGPPIE